MAVDDSQVLFTTTRESERVQLEGSIEVTTDSSGDATAQVNHNLGTVYQFVVHDTDTGETAPGFFQGANKFYAFNSANTLTIKFIDADPSTTKTINYKILSAEI